MRCHRCRRKRCGNRAPGWQVCQSTCSLTQTVLKGVAHTGLRQSLHKRTISCTRMTLFNHARHMAKGTARGDRKMRVACITSAFIYFTLVKYK